MSYINNENFLAVALVINRSRDGPAFVFHYPSHVQPVSGVRDRAEVDELEDILFERLSQPADGETSRLELADKLASNDDHHMTEAGTRIVPWEHVAGFTARDLAGILTPARSYHKRLFQLSLDPLLCVSYPIHVPENGKWKKTRRTKAARAARAAARLADETPASASASASVAHHETEQSPTAQQHPDACEDRERRRDDADEEKRSSMTMFNLVFILHPRRSETKDLVDSIFSNIVRKVNKAYQYSQRHSDFVWKESKRILAAKDRAREEQKNMSVLWRELLQNSSLAASMHDIYEAVSQNKIATLHLDTVDGVLTPSVQIPAPFFISDLPPEDDERQRGLWLTTANAFLSQDALEEPGFLDRNFALLLTDNEKKIVSELQSDRDPATLPMVEFVRLAKPTMSFYQIGQSHVLTLSQVRKYAQHFIFWRRAIAIPPLHPRDIYIVSPNCDLRRLPQASQEWQRAFPLAPPLPNFLAELSACPRPYKRVSPSKAHRPLYLRMLTWLMRGGWVTQLCTFAYVVVWPEILYEVDYEMEAEELGTTTTVAATATATATAAAAAAAATVAAVSPTDAAEGSNEAQIQNSAVSDAQTGELPSPPDDQPPHQPPPQSQPQPLLLPNPSTLSDAEHSAEMARLERIALKAHREAADKATAHARKTIPVATSHPSVNDAAHLAGLTPHIILDPKKATGTESRYLSAIARRFKDDGVRSAWQLMCKYFDGRCALERIALQEDMKRKETWTRLMGMREHLMCTRHW